MKHHNQQLLLRILLIVGSVISYGFISTVAAEGIDIEPNNACKAAQDMGEITLPFVIDGRLENTLETNDIDFFKFTGQPGSLVKVDYKSIVGVNTDFDPYLGLFNVQCNLLDFNDDKIIPGINNNSNHNTNVHGSTRSETDSRLQFIIPDNGVFILSASSCCDANFNGNGNTNGNYQITIVDTSPISFIESITGRVVVVVPNDVAIPAVVIETHIDVSLLRCLDDRCKQLMSVRTDTDGQFRFDQDFNGNPLITGLYQIQVIGRNRDHVQIYESATSDLFEVGDSENFDTGDILLQPIAIEFSDIEPCTIPSAGGACLYNVRVTNNRSTPLRGLAWSMVDAHETGASPTKFPAGKKRINQINIDAQSSEILQFQFFTPKTVKDGARICTNISISKTASLFNIIGERQLFCVKKGS
jgi:hypothetical protein